MSTIKKVELEIYEDDDIPFFIMTDDKKARNATIK